MREPNYIRFVVSRPLRDIFKAPIPELDHYRSGSWLRRKVVAWLMRVAKKLLTVCDAYALDERTTFKEVTVDKSSVANRFIQAGYLLQIDGFDRPRFVLVGPDILRELQDEVRDSISFDLSFRRTDPYGHMEYVGFTVIYVPHMRGFLPLTKSTMECLRLTPDKAPHW